jgi:hypothetical protein
MAMVFVGRGLLYLIRGADAPGAYGMSQLIMRVAGGFILLLGLGVGLAAVFVDAEAPGARGGDRWGGAAGVVVLSVWLVLLAVALCFTFSKSRR